MIKITKKNQIEKRIFVHFNGTNVQGFLRKH